MSGRLISTGTVLCVKRGQRMKYGAYKQLGYMFEGTVFVTGPFLVITLTILDSITSAVLSFLTGSELM